jgi:Protein of unknown function (DUF2934)
MAGFFHTSYSHYMKINKYPQDKTQKPAETGRVANGKASHGAEADFAPSADAVARKAYFCYVNEGSQPGRDVQHWLTAEAELIAERNLTRVHGFHNKT